MLQEGPKFAVTPATIPIKEYISTTTGAALQANELNGVDCSGLYHDVNRILNTFTNKSIHTNIIKAEHLALEKLRKDKDHIIVTSDKGVVLVVMDKQNTSQNVKPPYKTTQFISISPKTHLQLSTKNSLKILQDYKNNNFISETEYTQLRPHGSNSPAARFIGLPKIHKNNMSMHPIVSACCTATYNTAKFITKILQNYCGKTSSFVKDSTDFIQEIKHLSINPEEETLVSLMSMFSLPAFQYLLHCKLSIPKFLPAPISSMSARSLLKNSSSFWNSL